MRCDMLGSVRARLALAAVFALLVLDTAAAQSAPAVASRARTLQVGPTRLYKKPSEAAAVALDGDIVEIDAGIYLGDACAWTRHNLILRGVGTGRAHLIANGAHAQGKGTWVISGTNATVENIEFSGAAVPDKNGAGIRQEGAGLTVRRCSFHDNQNGILTSANAASDILIEFSEFYANGYGDGLTHNMYIGKVRTFTLRHCHTYRAKVGHLIKSRAETNYILYNRITCEATGTTSYEINLPNGGRSYVIGNLIQQGPSAGNSTLLSYAEEGATNAVQELYVVHNTFVNERTAGGTFVRVSGTPAQSKLINNIFAGPGTVLSGTGTQTTNLASSSPGLVNASGYDYRLTATSPALNAGSNPGTGGGYNLTPVYQYVHPLNREARTANGAPDLGAYESGAPAPNTAPVVDAGPARTITLPSTASLDGTVTDDGKPSGTLTQNWTKVSGPGTVTFANASAVDTTASFSVAGTYSLRLTASDSALSASDTVTVTVNAAPVPNAAPVVDAGPARTITLPSTASLDGTVTDDGKPSGTLTQSWTKVSGPGTVTFANASAVDTTASFSVAGTYSLRLTASDSALSASDTVTVTVNAAPAPNTAPVVDAGPARTITLPSTASLDGTVTDDGKPSGTLTQSWTKVSGPGTVTFANASAVDTTASFSVAGTYSLRLTASDSALSASDTVTVTVNAAPAPNRAPVVESDPFAAPNPAAIAQSVSFTALAADSDGDALTYAWTFGDGASASGSSVAHAYAAAGTFNARVTISDGRGGSVSRTLAVSVAQAPVEKVKLSGRVNFAVAERDSCSVSGYIAWPEGRTAEGARVELDVGGVRVAGALDDRGSVKVGLHTLRVIVPRRPGPARFVATLKAGVFAPAWVNEGVTNADARRVPLTFLVRLKVDALVFESADPVLYTARAGKTGSFR